MGCILKQRAAIIQFGVLMLKSVPVMFGPLQANSTSTCFDNVKKLTKAWTGLKQRIADLVPFAAVGGFQERRNLLSQLYLVIRHLQRPSTGRLHD